MNCVFAVHVGNPQLYRTALSRRLLSRRLRAGPDILAREGAQPRTTMTMYWIWWVAAAILIVAELLTGTFYLLVMGVAVACAGVAAVLGASLPLQWLVAGVLGVAGIAAIQRWKHRTADARPVQQALDIGAPVQVLTWGPNHTARVAYRGTRWDAELASPDTPQAETMYIADMRGSVLILADRRPGAPQAAA
jgi:membrane protein implicated in regulation of membrane protease activity